MSGHSKWSTIKRAKEAVDAKRGVLFTRLSKNITIAARKGKDPSMNASLRTAIESAREVNVPKDLIERAIARGAGEFPGQTIEEVVYEGFGPGGVALLIRCATDNTNRTAGSIKSMLSKYGGNLSGPGSVHHLFRQRGVIRTSQCDEATQLAAVEAGAEDLVEEDNGLTVYTEPSRVSAVKNALASMTSVEFAKVVMVPDTPVEVADQKEKSKLDQLLFALGENDDVVEVMHNANL